MTPKKRLTKKDPSYYVPLPYAMAVRRVIDAELFDALVFEGMQLQLVKEGLINISIAITANYQGSEHVLAYVPKGMTTRIEGLMEHDEKIVVSVERKYCDRLKSSFWISFDELPSLKEIGL